MADRKMSLNELSEKELSVVSELLNEEELLVKKFQMLASHAQDETVKQQMLDIANKHQGHFNDIYAYIK